MARNTQLETRHNTPDIDYEAEDALIGIILAGDLDARLLFDSLLDVVPSSGYFAGGPHRAVFDAANKLYMNSDKPPIIPASIKFELETSGRFTELASKGGGQWLTELQDTFAPQAALWEYYAGRVRDSFTKRTSMRLGQQFFSDLAQSNGNLPDILNSYIERFQQAKIYAETGKKAVWTPLTLADAQQDKPPRQYVVDRVLSTPSLSIWYGPPGSLKTMVLLDLALSVATGKPWLAARPGERPVTPFRTTPTPVLWFDQDSGQDEIERRIAAIAQAKEADSNTPFYYLSFPMPAFQGDDTSTVGAMIDLIEQTGAKLVVIDCLNTISGAADENSPQMASVMAGLRQIAERTGAAVIVIHHSSKDNPKNLRGHSSINGAIDLAMSVYRDAPDAVDVIFEATKVRQSPIEPFAAYFAYSSKDDHPGELESACFFGTGRPQFSPDNMNRIDQAMYFINQLAPDGMSQNEIVGALQGKASRNAVREALEKMTAAGDFETKPGARGAIVYTYLG